MITKFEIIKKFAVFRDFNWDHTVQNSNGSVAQFSDINILYGRNYSGKTTLSRLLRAMQTGYLSDKYESPEFRVKLNDGSEIDQNNYSLRKHLVRVFNEDFIRDNLKFITNPDERIVPFAVIGDENIKIEEQIKALENEIGSDVVGKETGLRSRLVLATKAKDTAESTFQKARLKLDQQLAKKSTDRQSGIKYRPERYGDQNYTKPKLESDIKLVLDERYVSLTDSQVKKHEQLIHEKTKPSISSLPRMNLIFAELSSETQRIVTQKVGQADKIEELVEDAILNKWAKDGKEYHEKKREFCAFCGNKITEDRWSRLIRHFDEESDKLEKAIDALLFRIKQEEEVVKTGFNVNKNDFYVQFQDDLEALSKDYFEESKKYFSALDGITTQLKSRKVDIINAQDFKKQIDYSAKIETIRAKYEKLRVQSNAFSVRLKDEQSKAQKALRLDEVHKFVNTINYRQQLKDIKDLQNTFDTKKDYEREIAELIDQKLNQISDLRRKMRDEENGAIKINEYLTHFFGHCFLTLQAKQEVSVESGKKIIHFEVIREKQKAFHLSEGECRLLAFCYFLAKLEDTETKGTKPIIWIDDPISSLDANHIFFAFSLIANEIVHKGKFKQLFISTHNLDFLKYLKRLNGFYLDQQGSKKNYQKRYFILQRQDKDSIITVMPKYLKEYVTEFNYLFHQIYKCANIDIINDTNYTTYYNFANNARKFLEIFLYYKYPDGASEWGKLERFFGDDSIPSILIDRINNEYSHMAGVFERGETPVEVPEMKTTAKLILEKLKNDKEQYNSLLNSIGEPPLL
ncbi:AAA family ATPase [candidate division KSB1 bacterium]|nr:AAA family ATPase [candidate division KSB1 bacterium]